MFRENQIIVLYIKREARKLIKLAVNAEQGTKLLYCERPMHRPSSFQFACQAQMVEAYKNGNKIWLE